MIFKEVRIRQKYRDSMVRHYNVPHKKKTTNECNHISEISCREVICNILVCRLAAPVLEEVHSKSDCTLNSSASKFKFLPKLPLQFKDFPRIFSRMWSPCLPEHVLVFEMKTYRSLHLSESHCAGSVHPSQ